MLIDLMDLLRATEAGAIAASDWVGTGDKIHADQAATEAMRERLNRLEIAGKVVIGEGKKDDSYGLFNGDWVGKYAEQKSADYYELAVDPIDGTRPTVTSGPEALSVLAVANAGSMFTTEEYYMHKLAYGSWIANKVKLSIKDPLEAIIEKVSQATGKSPSKIVVCLLDRPRHEKYIAVLRKLGVRTKLIQDCDISGAIATCLPDSGIDFLYGIGGATESVITAAAMKCLGGGFQSQIVNKECTVFQPKVYEIEDLVKGPCAFAATGITNGSLLKGVRFTNRGPVTHSVVMRSKSGTVRWVTAYHGN